MGCLFSSDSDKNPPPRASRKDRERVGGRDGTRSPRADRSRRGKEENRRRGHNDGSSRRAGSGGNAGGAIAGGAGGNGGRGDGLGGAMAGDGGLGGVNGGDGMVGGGASAGQGIPIKRPGRNDRARSSIDDDMEGIAKLGSPTDRRMGENALFQDIIRRTQGNFIDVGGGGDAGLLGVGGGGPAGGGGVVGGLGGATDVREHSARVPKGAYGGLGGAGAAAAAGGGAAGGVAGAAVGGAGSANGAGGAGAADRKEKDRSVLSFGLPASALEQEPEEGAYGDDGDGDGDGESGSGKQRGAAQRGNGNDSEEEHEEKDGEDRLSTTSSMAGTTGRLGQRVLPTMISPVPDAMIMSARECAAAVFAASDKLAVKVPEGLVVSLGDF